MQVDFTGLSRRALTRKGTAVYPKGQPSTDQSRSKVGAEEAILFEEGDCFQ